MPHLPDHRNHDLLLIAALAAGDGEGADLEQARDLVAACDECAALHHDLRAISAALPATPAPTRSRDFRLTPEQAGSLRPAGWRRLLAPLAGPRFAFAAPLGGSLAALGIAGILVAGAASTPIANVAGERQAVSLPAAASPAFEVELSAPSVAASLEPDRVLLPDTASQVPAAAAPGMIDTGPAASDPAGGAGTVASKDNPAPTASPTAEPAAPLAETVSGGQPPVLAILSAVLVTVGLLLVALRLGGRRLGSGT